MSEISTIARPYAKAIFELAKAEGTLAKWSDDLGLIKSIVNDESFNALIQNPATEKSVLTQILGSVSDGKISEQANNLVQVLVNNSRMNVAQAITDQFELLKSEEESVIEATVESAQELDESQLASLAKSLTEKFGKTVKLDASVNEDLMGGVLIRAGDTVIDGSVRSKLNKLASAIRA